MKLTPGVNSIKVFCSPFLFEGGLRSFSLIMVTLCYFLLQLIGEKATHIKLMKLAIEMQDKNQSSSLEVF